VLGLAASGEMTLLLVPAWAGRTGGLDQQRLVKLTAAEDRDPSFEAIVGLDPGCGGNHDVVLAAPGMPTTGRPPLDRCRPRRSGAGRAASRSQLKASRGRC
jgi:hypothetical protein